MISNVARMKFIYIVCRNCHLSHLHPWLHTLLVCKSFCCLNFGLFSVGTTTCSLSWTMTKAKLPLMTFQYYPMRLTVREQWANWAHEVQAISLIRSAPWPLVNLVCSLISIEVYPDCQDFLLFAWAPSLPLPFAPSRMSRPQKWFRLYILYSSSIALLSYLVHRRPIQEMRRLSICLLCLWLSHSWIQWSALC